MIFIMDDCNHFGTVAESRTHTKLTELGYIVFTTREERLPYDRVISHPCRPEKFLRIQIKGTRSYDDQGQRGRYQIWPSKGKGNNKKLYTKDEIDIVIAHIEGADGALHWYIIPVEKIKSTRIRLNPYTTRSLKTAGQYEKYREAWHLLDKHFRVKRD